VAYGHVILEALEGGEKKVLPCSFLEIFGFWFLNES